MITSGIVRKIDDLGRVVLPKEIRKYLNINPGDDFKIEIEGNKITLEKFSKLGNYENQILNIINCFLGVIEEKIYLVVNNNLINHNNELINNDLFNIILQRKVYINDSINKIMLSNDFIIEGKLIIYPIVIDSDLLGAIIVIGNNVSSMLIISKILFNIIKYKQSI